MQDRIDKLNLSIDATRDNLEDRIDQLVKENVNLDGSTKLSDTDFDLDKDMAILKEFKSGNSNPLTPNKPIVDVVDSAERRMFKVKQYFTELDAKAQAGPTPTP